jgi:hypothetical protein
MIWELLLLNGSGLSSGTLCSVCLLAACFRTLHSSEASVTIYQCTPWEPQCAAATVPPRLLSLEARQLEQMSVCWMHTSVVLHTTRWACLRAADYNIYCSIIAGACAARNATPGRYRSPLFSKLVSSWPLLKRTSFWGLTPYSPVNVSRCFGG